MKRFQKYRIQEKVRTLLTVKVGKRKLFFLIWAVAFLSGLLVSNHVVRMKRQQELLTGKVLAPTCLHPVLPIDDPSIMKHMINVDRIVCDGTTDWVEVNGTHAYVTKMAKEKYEGPIVCKFYEILRIDDDSTKISERITVGLWYTFQNVDFIEVSCTARREKWSSYFAAPRPSVSIRKPKPYYIKSSRHPPLNVVMWGHDSLSRNMFIRKLPMSYEYLTNNLNGQVLKGYNIVGDGTPQALIPILTGKTELELPETRKRKGTLAKNVDVYPFVWKEFSNNGYLTGYMEDCPDIGTFTFRLKGFLDSPTDFYMRPYFLAASKLYSQFPKYCIGSVPRLKKMTDYIQHILNFKKEVPKFLFGFHSELSHGDANTIQGADHDMREFLQDMHNSGILNTTILIIMSDHGHRFASFRETQQGKLEERMPNFMFVFPKWFSDAYPLAYKNFVTNTQRLSTPFDIHATFQDILNLPKLDNDYFTQPNSKTFRQMSLFREIPATRTCTTAKIEPHWCACLQWRVISTNSTVALYAALEFVNFINEITNPQRELCSELTLRRILWVAHLHPTDELLRFRKSADEDGFKPELSDHATITSTVLQLKLETHPGHGHFEVSMTYDINNYQFNIKESDISRVDKYSSQAFCIDINTELEHMRKYCYCRRAVL